MTFDVLLEEALKLPPAQRERLALRLSLLDPPAAEPAAILTSSQEAVLKERTAAYEANPHDVMPAAESIARARHELAQHRRQKSRKSKSA